MPARERVFAALNHREPDRVPTALGGGPYGIVDELYFQLLRCFELGEPVAQFREGHSISYLDDRVLQHLGVDTRYVWAGDTPSNLKPVPGQLDTFVDGYGQTWKRALPYYYAERGILAEATVDEIDRLVTWPDVDDPRWTAGVHDRAQSLRENTDAFVVARMITSHGPFQTASHLRGTERFLMDLALDEAFAEALIGRITDTIDGLLRRYLEAGGRHFDMIELPGDDYASNENTLISLRMFRKYFKPALRRLVETVKGYRDDLVVMFHSDGMIAPLLSDLIEIGVDVVHPLEPVPAMDLAAVKAEFGQRLTFLGAIDIAHALPGTQQDVIEEVKRRIRQLAPGGGYILAPANHVQADVPPENVVTLFEAARQFGKYPIRIPE